jgi:4-hydroxy-2-oxoheptanedioate aldolase
MPVPGGVQVPAVETAKHARTIVEASHFPPHGRRGFGSTPRAAGYGFFPRPDVIQKAEDLAVIIQIETSRGVENLAEILAVDGIDMIFIGTGDLSLDHGYSSPADPAMLPLPHQTIRIIQGAGKACGVHITDLKSIPQMKERGVRFFTVSALAIIGQSLRGLVRDSGEELEK